ncbi:MAG: hypothetical protein FD131_2802 [Rhodocyclaceae bacterium]|nr:MAG: hypothetical protein FD131_2802 [Rhodocyclaceae bacterium]
MPLALVIALAASLGIHAAALFGTDVEIFGGADEPVPLRAELQPPPPPSAAEQKPVVKPRPKPAKPAPLASAKPSPTAETVAPAPETKPSEIAPNLPSTLGPAVDSVVVATKEQEPAKPLLPAKGRMRFVIYYGTQGFQIGRAEHSWEFTEDGRYRLTGMTETSGLVALFKPLVFENESSGRLVAGGLQPETYRTRKNGKDANENADFDWLTAEVRLSRSGAVQPVSPGSQDILSLNYQLAYLRKPEGGATVGVVTGKKYDRFALDSLGEEEIDIPAGHFRTLHLRAMGDTVTEIWIALDRHRLPVKIRYTDKKGDIFEQVATEIGSP